MAYKDCHSSVNQRIKITVDYDIESEEPLEKIRNLSKKDENYIKHFELVFDYINFGLV